MNENKFNEYYGLSNTPMIPSKGKQPRPPKHILGVSIRTQTSVAGISASILSHKPKELRRLAKWLNKMADYLETRK